MLLFEKLKLSKLNYFELFLHIFDLIVNFSLLGVSVYSLRPEVVVLVFYQFVDSLVLWSVFIFWSHDLNILLKLFYAQLTLFLHRNLLRILHKKVINLLFNELFVAVLVFSVYFHRHQYCFLHCIRHMGEQNFQREVLFIFIDPVMHHLHRFLLLTKRLQVALLLTLKPLEYKVFEGVVLYFLICLVLKVQISAWGFFHHLLSKTWINHFLSKGHRWRYSWTSERSLYAGSCSDWHQIFHHFENHLYLPQKMSSSCSS